MKYICSFFLFIVLFTVNAPAQDITGIWKGYFAWDCPDHGQERMDAEVQVIQLPKNAISGVAYAYQNKTIYSKAAASGTYFTNTHNFSFTESKVLKSFCDDACLHTYKLHYKRKG